MLTSSAEQTHPTINTRTGPYFNPANADDSFGQLLDGEWEEQGDCQLYRAVEGNGDKHAAGGDGVAQEHVHSEGGEDDDLAAGKEGGHVESSQVGTPQYLCDFFPGKRRSTRRVVRFPIEPDFAISRSYQSNRDQS